MIIPERVANWPIRTGSFKDAQRDAQSDIKFLCILLLSADHPACAPEPLRLALGKDDEELSGLVARRCIVWAADVDSDAGDLVSATCQPAAFPYFAVTFKSKVVMEIQGEFSPADLRAALTECMETAETDVAKEVAFAADRQARDSERNMHEAQMAALMEEDRRRAQEKEAAERRKRDEEAAEQERLARLLREAEERKKAEEEAALKAEEKKALAMSSVPDVPPADAAADQITTIRLTMLCGKTETRKFLRSTPLSGLYSWAESLPEYDGNVPYELIAGFPPQLVERKDDETIGDRKLLIPRCVLTMKKL